MKVDVEVKLTAEALDQGDRAGPGRRVGMARFLDQMSSNDAVNRYPIKSCPFPVRKKT